MSNRLARETSPYLRQHADNPVDWYPWGEEALTLSRDTGKPILLSIGYSACHWCHVMAHESFEDPAIAAIMNAHFINIKVDREERPDLDQVYQTAHALLTQGNGGWPLTMFLAPDRRPFFGGTYFPKTARYGLPGFGDLLLRVATAYRGHTQAIAAQNDVLVGALARGAQHSSDTHALTAAAIEGAEQALADSFDRAHGGFGDAPKFPHPTELAFLLQRYADSGVARDGEMVFQTLAAIADGGLFDQLGGGFCRYSVDREWSIPHFEKMLYDNGLLLALYADAFAASRKPQFARTVRATAEWIQREMQSPEGGYYSSLDADSEGEEGKFYVWSREQVRALLSPEEYVLFAPMYGLTGAPNFEGKYWHLRVVRPFAEVAAEAKIAVESVSQVIARASGTLLRARERRVRPGRDEKILTSWNALAIIGMARAARVFHESTWAASARRAFEFVRRAMWRGGRLHATYNAGEARLNAYLDDYAFLLAATLELAQTALQQEDLVFARALADALLERFSDHAAGGFYFTSDDHEALLYRPKTAHDSALPSGNGIAAQALLRLGHLLGEPKYVDAAERTVRTFSGPLGQYPNGHCSLLTALAELEAAPVTVILRGPAPACVQWHAHLSDAYRPHMLVVAANELTGLPDVFGKPAGNVPLAYVCRDQACLAPIRDKAELDRLL